MPLRAGSAFLITSRPSGARAPVASPVAAVEALLSTIAVDGRPRHPA
jgi:hypothetical protein